MKKLALSVVMLMVLLAIVVLVMPTIARAESWSGQDWFYLQDHGGSLTNDGSGNLYFNSSGSANSSAVYGSNLNTTFNNDFGAWVHFSNSSIIPESGLEFGLARLGAGGTTNPDLIINGSVDGHTSGGDAFNFVNKDISGTQTHLWTSAARTSDDGWMGLRYIKSTDTLGIGFFSTQPTLNGTPEFGGFDITNFTHDYGSADMKFYVSGHSGQPITGQQMSFDNFGTTVTPEPVSSALFLLGGGVLAARRFNKNKV